MKKLIIAICICVISISFFCIPASAEEGTVDQESSRIRVEKINEEDATPVEGAIFTSVFEETAYLFGKSLEVSKVTKITGEEAETIYPNGRFYHEAFKTIGVIENGFTNFINMMMTPYFMVFAIWLYLTYKLQKRNQQQMIG